MCHHNLAPKSAYLSAISGSKTNNLHYFQQRHLTVKRQNNQSTFAFFPTAMTQPMCNEFENQGRYSIRGDCPLFAMEQGCCPCVQCRVVQGTQLSSRRRSF